MDQKTRKIVIVGSLLTLGGIGAYLGYQAWKKRNDANAGYDDYGSTDFDVSSPTTMSDRPDNVLKFQQWVINVKKDKSILGKGGPSGFGDDGVWGGNTATAWKKYKTEYQRGSSTAVNTGSGLNAKNVDVILQPIAKSLGSGAKYGQTSDSINYVTYKSSSTGYQYYWYANGIFKVWKSPNTLAYGSFSNKGNKVDVTVGPNKGKTISMKDPLSTAYEATIDRAPKMAESTAKLIAKNLRTAMSGVGTINQVFWDNVYNIKNTNQWIQVFNAFNVLTSGNLDTWVDDDLQKVDERVKWNTYATKANIPLRLVEVEKGGVSQKTV